MDKEEFNEYLVNRYQKQMDYYRRASAKNQRIYNIFQLVLIILSFLSPIIASLNGVSFRFIPIGAGLDLKWILITTSSSVAVLTTILKTFRYQELWITYRSTYEKLKPEIFYYKFSVGPYSEIDENKEKIFISRIEALINSEHSLWSPAKKA